MSITTPGVPQPTKLLFLRSRVAWLSERTFTADIYLCPRNGHEGAITNLFRQLLMSRQDHVDASGVTTVVFDVGANLGFYSLLPLKMGWKTYAFDIQPTCLRGLELMAKSNGVSENLVMYNAGMSETMSFVRNSFGGCDYENHMDPAVASGGAGTPGDVTALPLDRVVEQIEKSLGTALQVHLLKIDTEGAEASVLHGMRHTLQQGKITNMIVEVTPAHWKVVGMSRDDAHGIKALTMLTDEFGFEAYALYLPVARQPPAHLYHILKPEDTHPLLPEVHGLGCTDDKKNVAVHWRILDMRAFLTDYCVTFLGSAGVKNGGFCGNIWFHKRVLRAASPSPIPS